MFEVRDKSNEQSPENIGPVWLSINLFMLFIVLAVLGSLLLRYDYNRLCIFIYFLSLTSLFTLIRYHFVRECPHCGHKQPTTVKNVKMNLFPTDYTQIPFACPNCKLLYRRGSRRDFNYLSKILEERLIGAAGDTRKLALFFRNIIIVIFCLTAASYFSIFYSTITGPDNLIPVAFLFSFALYLHICLTWRDSKSSAKRAVRTIYCWLVPIALIYYSIVSYNADNQAQADFAIGQAVIVLAIYCFHNLRLDKKLAKRSHKAGPH